MKDMVCTGCGKAGTKTCSGCGTVNYCSMECQRQDWKEHKKNCAATTTTIHHTPEFGRHFIASRNIKAGSLIICEEASFFAPRCADGSATPSCLSCCQPTLRLCSKCKWPVCSKLCEEVQSHSEYECGHFSEKKVPFTTMDMDRFYDIQILRMIMTKTKFPERWRTLSTHQSEYNLPSKELEEEAINSALQAGRFKLDEVVVEDWINMFKAAKINSFSIRTRESDCGAFMNGVFLFTKSSLFTNSCSPNCFYSFTPALKISVRAAVDIRKGDVLTICYDAGSMFCGTFTRLKHHMKTAGFICKCSRCRDKSEMGTNISAWNCQVCKVGLLLPTDPVDETCLWPCSNAANCTNSITSDFVDKITTQIYTRIQDYPATSESTEYPTTLFNMLEKYSGRSLPTDHWLMLAARRGILAYITSTDYGEKTGNMELMNVFIEHAQKILPLMERILPGISFPNAALKLQLSMLVLDKAAAKVKSALPREITRGSEEFEEFQKKLQLGYKWYKEALAYFVHDKSQTLNPHHLGPEAKHLTEFISRLKTYERVGYRLE